MNAIAPILTGDDANPEASRVSAVPDLAGIVTGANHGGQQFQVNVPDTA